MHNEGKPPGLSEEISKNIQKMQGKQTGEFLSLFSLETCRAGQSGCPNTLYDVKGLAEKIESKAQENKFHDRLAKKCQHLGPILFHHRFQACLAGCPNACSQPQIKDFGLVGQRRPACGEEKCNQCMKCVETCLEKAITLQEDGPVFDYTKCVKCGQCQMVCPTGTIINDQKGLKITAGGKLGRHPKFAETLAEFAEESRAISILEELMKFFLNEGREGERLGSLLERKTFSL